MQSFLSPPPPGESVPRLAAVDGTLPGVFDAVFGVEGGALSSSSFTSILSSISTSSSRPTFCCSLLFHHLTRTCFGIQMWTRRDPGRAPGRPLRLQEIAKGRPRETERERRGKKQVAWSLGGGDEGDEGRVRDQMPVREKSGEGTCAEEDASLRVPREGTVQRTLGIEASKRKRSGFEPERLTPVEGNP